MGRVVWFTGLSGAGKTTIAMAAAERFGCEVLDGDTIRDFFANHDFSREGRERHLLGIAKMAKMMSKHTDVLCSFITPYEDVREKILEILPGDALMVHVSTSLEVCEERDVKGLYAKARTGEISNSYLSYAGSNIFFLITHIFLLILLARSSFLTFFKLINKSFNSLYSL